MINRLVSQARFSVPVGTQKSIYFNGTTDKATVPIIPLTTGFNVGLWFRLPVPLGAANSRIVSWQGGSAADGFTIRQATGFSGIYFLVYNAGGETLSLTKVIKNYNWYHVVATFLPNDGKLYIDNTSVGSDTSCSMTTNIYTSIMLGNATNGSAFWKGNIKNFTFQNTTTAWTQEQIYQLYYNNIIPSGATQYSMNDVATDQNGANALTLTGTSYSTDVPGHMTTRSASPTRSLSGARTAV